MAIFFVFVVLLIFQVISGKEVDPRIEEEDESGEFTELTIFFEEDPAAPVEAAVVKEESPAPEAETEDPEFATTSPDQEEEAPEDADFIGERDTMASSDADAVAGDEDQVALSGDREVKGDIKTATTDFSDGDEVGKTLEQDDMAAAGPGKERESQEEINEEVAEAVEEMKEEEYLFDSFRDTDGVEERMEDKLVERPEKTLEPKESIEEALEREMKEESQLAKEQGGASGGFETKQTKTRVRGTLNASGRGSLDVKNSPLGRYEAQIFRVIEREWQARNFQFRSHLAPGHVTIRFVIDEKGKVSGQRRMEMLGASDIQWGIILNSLSAADLPPMPQDVRKELEGDTLELNVTFNY
ncbi:MAG: hypothetical protein ACSHYF_08440 [Verrucomicrobiaceae bacterium]